MLAVDDVASEDPDLATGLHNLRALLDRDRFIGFCSMVRRVVDALTNGDPAAERALTGLDHLLVGPS